MPDSLEKKQEAVAAIRTQLAQSIGAKKCHPCGCFRQSIETLLLNEMARGELTEELKEARAVLEPQKYDCLGCAVCWPAVAMNALAEADPDSSNAAAHCPTGEVSERPGWPPLPGDYRVLRYRAPVALCTLHSDDLVQRVFEAAPEGLAIVGTLHTENLGIERVIRNVLANSNIRILILCGEDTVQAVGHLPGWSLSSLFQNGIDEQGRILGAKGKRPILKNVTADQVAAFRRQVSLLEHIGVTDLARILDVIHESAGSAPGVFGEAHPEYAVEAIRAEEPRKLVLDPAGFFVVYPDGRRNLIVVEHYTTSGVLNVIVEGKTSPAVYAEVIGRNLVTRLDHAAYLGRELARAERSLRTGEPYVQDRAPGKTEVEPVSAPSNCGCGAPCGE